MRISELSRQSRVPIPAIKFYLREGLLPAGERTSPNQVSYGEQHVHRLRLIRVLLELGRLSVQDVRQVVTVVDAPELDVHRTLGAVQRSVAPAEVAADPESIAGAETMVSKLAEAQGWDQVKYEPMLRTVVDLLVAADAIGQSDIAAMLEPYAQAASTLAEREIEWVGKAASIDAMAERVVVGTVLGDALMLAIRRIAQVHESARSFGSRT